MDDYLHSCMSDLKEKDPTVFMETFCKRCRNPDCTHAKWSSDKFGSRTMNQMERFFNPNQADPTSSRYSMLVDFADMMETAVRLEIADLRKDWEVPEPMNISKHTILVPRTATAIPEPEPEPQVIILEPPVVSEPIPTLKAPPSMPRASNTTMQNGGMLLGPPMALPPAADPWAGPVSGKSKVVPKGAKIQFGPPKSEEK